MVFQNPWVSQSRFVAPGYNYVRLAVSFFIRRCLEVPIRLFVFLNDVFSSLDIELH